MNTYDFVHLALWSLGGEIRGKTKLQKTVYFLGRLMRRLDDLGYSAHYYGPYSSEVADAVDRLLSLGFLTQTVSGGGVQDSHGFGVARYDFALSEEGKRVAETKAKSDEDFSVALSGAVEMLKCAGDLDYVRLSIAAKTDFMLAQKGGAANVTELAELAKTFGWHVEPNEISDAARLLETLRLAKAIN
jgi:uncharacterized protein YwgA